VESEDIAGQEWWRGSVIYQVYPRSFQDSNDDGIGDLNGIIRRLPYIASLGVDAVWISPFFRSPMKDMGYDVSDYCDIDPIFGTLDDFDVLLERARELGLKVIIDLVLSHSSDQHPWFSESRQSRDNERADWYVWSEPKADGTPPNNWLSVFGGSAWQWDSQRQQYYLHNFLASQPDLNLHNTAVQDALLDVVRFWLERGVDGFRLDAINLYFHDKQLRNNPALTADMRNDNMGPQVNPYNYQQHLYSKNQPENLDFLKRLRAVLDEYDTRTSLGEVIDPQRGLEILGQYTAGNERVHMCYVFDLLQDQPATPSWIRQVFSRFAEVAADGCVCWAFSNHDVIRYASRWNLSNAAIKLHATLLMCLHGSVCIYQGDELGLHEADVPFENLQDPWGIEFWPMYKGRDGCRTPMVWEELSPNAGFSSVPPWLPVSAEHKQRAVSVQEMDNDSLLHHYRRAIALRQHHPTIVLGDIEFLDAGDNVLCFVRHQNDVTICCLFNMSDAVAEVSLPRGQWRNLNTGIGIAEIPASGLLRLGAWQAALAIKTGD
jgi:alpha-glucosidase